jgi:hypothetical protein
VAALKKLGASIRKGLKSRCELHIPLHTTLAR